MSQASGWCSALCRLPPPHLSSSPDHLTPKSHVPTTSGLSPLAPSPLPVQPAFPPPPGDPGSLERCNHHSHRCNTSQIVFTIPGAASELTCTNTEVIPPPLLLARY
ncbi:hypothetical protein LY76DRAFT_156254 [Colletotrichum caudatum]|nr:hypothetical protein LY76DRAFT_156254 [Colletotrichum caudatum]